MQDEVVQNIAANPFARPLNSVYRIGEDGNVVEPILDISMLSPGVARQLSAVSVAVELNDGVYYEVGLGESLSAAGEESPLTIGQAANDFLESESKKRRVALNSIGENMFAAVNEKTNRLQVIGANLGGFGFQYNLKCEDCEKNLWADFADDFGGDISKPFFIGESDFVNRNHFSVEAGGGGLRPFAVLGFDDGENVDYHRLGLRYSGDFNGLGLFGEVSQIGETDSIVGIESNFFMNGKADTLQGKLSLKREFGDFWKGFIAYESAAVKVKTGKNSLLREFTNMQARGWRVGVEGKSIFANNDKLRLMVSQPTRLVKGDSVLSVDKTDISFVDYFYDDKSKRQTIYKGRDSISWKGETATVFTAGYAFYPSDNLAVSFGVEHAALSTKNRSAISLRFRWNLF